MARRRNIWEQIYESTEGPTVTLNLPREVAEQLLHMIAGALEVEDVEGGGDDMGDMGDGEDELDFGGGDDLQGPPEMGDEDEGSGFPEFGADAGDDDDIAAGDDDDEDDAPPAKKGPGRPPKKDKPKKDDADKKEESVRRLGAYVGRR